MAIELLDRKFQNRAYTHIQKTNKHAIQKLSVHCPLSSNQLSEHIHQLCPLTVAITTFADILRTFRTERTCIKLSNI